MFVEERFGFLFQCSAGRAEISNQRNQKNRALHVLWLQAIEKINQSYHKGMMRTKFSFSQSVLWNREERILFIKPVTSQSLVPSVWRSTIRAVSVQRHNAWITTCETSAEHNFRGSRKTLPEIRFINKIQKDATVCTYLFTASLLYMFRYSIAPIIRSKKL